MARPTKKDALQRDLKTRKFKFLEKILLVSPQIEDYMINTALGKNPSANESKRLEMARFLYTIQENYIKEVEKEDGEIDENVPDPKQSTGTDDHIVVDFGDRK